VALEYRVLGPLEATVDGQPVALGPPRHRALLVLLLAQANQVVPSTRLIDELWGEDPAPSAANILQGAVSQLRKALGKDAIETRGSGYAVRVEPDQLDVHRFERLANAGSSALETARFDEAAESLAEALALWRGEALGDLAGEDAVYQVAARLEELRLTVRERLLEAELGRGRHGDVLPDVQALAREHPLRERPHGLLMLALYRCGRQAEALEAYRTTRARLVDELGIEPGPALQELEQQILRQDAALIPAGPSPGPAPGPAPRPAAAVGPASAILVSPLDPAALDRLAALGEPLARDPPRELLLVGTVSNVDDLAVRSRELEARRAALAEQGATVRAAAFTSLAPGADLARLTREQAVELALVDAPDDLLEDARVLTLLEQAPCDVAIVAGAGRVAAREQEGPVLVPFAGAAHDWAAVELGAWLARNIGAELRLAGAATGPDGRDASRLLANASLAVQRALGVSAEPVLVSPEPDAVIEAASGAGVIVVGLTERWKRTGLGSVRTALATRASAPTILVRRGTRPGGLAPRGSETRFTWTLAGG
jgi:DNA-binding SARP family transcriptional activator